MLLLTGATGQVGSALLRRLLDDGVDVRCLVRRDPRRLGSQRVRVQIALGDLTDPPSFRNALRGVDTVVHLAATIRDQPNGSIEELNGIATWRIVRAAQRAGRGTVRVLLDARRLCAASHALSPSKGGSRAGCTRDRPGLDGVRPLDRLRPRRCVADAARTHGAGARGADVGHGARALSADLGRGRRRVRDGGPARPRGRAPTVRARGPRHVDAHRDRQARARLAAAAASRW